MIYAARLLLALGDAEILLARGLEFTVDLDLILGVSEDVTVLLEATASIFETQALRAAVFSLCAVIVACAALLFITHADASSITVKLRVTATAVVRLAAHGAGHIARSCVLAGVYQAVDLFHAGLAGAAITATAFAGFQIGKVFGAHLRRAHVPGAGIGVKREAVSTGVLVGEEEVGLPNCETGATRGPVSLCLYPTRLTFGGAARVAALDDREVQHGSRELQPKQDLTRKDVVTEAKVLFNALKDAVTGLCLLTQVGRGEQRSRRNHGRSKPAPLS